ncbi:MAG: hypothetical protein CMH81_04060 [Nitrospiraceae bacterium]|nr:hypothetical protein [Nitrospiraceae bacterium]
MAMLYTKYRKRFCDLAKLGVLSVAVGVLFLFGPLGVNVAVAEHEELSEQAAASPCPSNAPEREFNIAAFRVSIVYNTYGDTDPVGAMYAFVGEKDAILQQVDDNPGKPSWRVQPLVMRANVGDCIKMNLRNDLAGGASLTLSRAQYNVLNSEGTKIGRNETGDLIPAGGNHTYTFFIEDKSENQGSYHIHNTAAPTIENAYTGLFASLNVQAKGSRYISSYTGEDLNQEGDGGPAPHGGRWEAIIIPCEGVDPGESTSCDRLFDSPGAGPGTANPLYSFREHTIFYHDGLGAAGGWGAADNKFFLGTGKPESEACGEDANGCVVVQTHGTEEEPEKFTLTPRDFNIPGYSPRVPVELPVKGEGFIDGSPNQHNLAGMLALAGLIDGPIPNIGANSTPSGVELAPNNNNMSFNETRLFGKAINYRFEPFDIRESQDADESLNYSSYDGGDPAAIIPRSYNGDPTVRRLLHGGGEERHIPHLHGMHRWPRQPYAERDRETGKFISKIYMLGTVEPEDGMGLTEQIARTATLLKNRSTNETTSQGASLNHVKSTVSSIIDVELIEPHTVRDMELECGAGSCEGEVGDFTEHCHVADHYTAGMWHFWRVTNVRQANLFPLPGRIAPPDPVDSIGLLASGTTLDGRKFCATGAEDCPEIESDDFVNIDQWVRHLLPLKGVPEGCGTENPRACPHPQNVVACPSLEGLTGNELLAAHQCQIRGYDADRYDYTSRLVGGQPLYLNEPDGPTFENFPNSPNGQGDFGGIGDAQGRFSNWKDTPIDSGGDDIEAIRANLPGPSPGQRPLLLFNPEDGRLAYPHHRPHRGKRPPLPGPPLADDSGSAHSGAPFLGEVSTMSPGTDPITAPKAELGTRPAGLCPQDAPVRSYDIVVTPVLGDGAVYNRFGDRDPNAAIHVLANDESELQSGMRQPHTLVVRGNVGDCMDIQYRNHLTDANPIQEEFSKANMHPHMMHFDVQASDGVIIGFNYEQSIRPSKDALAGIDVPGGEEICCEDRPAFRQNEFTRYRWYLDIEMMAFWHLHLQGIFGFSMGVTGGTVVEPAGSEYLDRITGEPIYRTHVEFPEPEEYAEVTENHNTLADDPRMFGVISKRGDEAPTGIGIMTRSISTPLNPARPEIENAGTELADITPADEPAFREAVFWMIDDVNMLLAETNEFTTHMAGPSAMNMRAERLDSRMRETGAAPHEVLQTSAGDPSTPTILAHPGDRVVLRVFTQGTQDAHSLRFPGQRFGWERFNADGRVLDTLTEAIGSFQHYELMGGAGGPSNVPGDYMWYMPIGALDFANGAWGIMRVGDPTGLQSIGNGGSTDVPDICASATGTQTYNVAAIKSPRRTLEAAKIFVLADADGNPLLDEVEKGQPLVMRANSGDCITVRLFNQLDDGHVGMTPGLLTLDPNSSYGFNFGDNADGQTVAPGDDIVYTWYAEPQMKPADGSLLNPDKGIGAIEWSNLGNKEQKRALGLSYIASFANVPEDLNDGLFAALVVEPKGSFWFDSETGRTLNPKKRTSVSAVIVPPNGKAFREHVLFMHENSVEFISNIRPLDSAVTAGAAFNYRRSPGGMLTKTDPRKINSIHLVTSQAGDPTRVRLVYTNGSEDVAFRLDGHRGPIEAGTKHSNNLNVWPMNVGHKHDIELDGGASSFPGDYLFGATEHRRLMDGGQWGIFRVIDADEAAALGAKDPETRLRGFTTLERATKKAQRKRDKGKEPNS